MAKSSTYWDKRALDRLSKSEQMTEEHIKRIKRMYAQAYKNVDEEIKRVYRNYSKDTGLDVQKLKELLTKKETDKVWKTLKRQGLDKYIKENYKARISRLEQVQAQIYAKAKQIYPKEELEHTMAYKGVINDSYYRAVYDTQMGTGFNFKFSKIDDNMLKTLLTERWSGKNYSERIWGNTDILAESLSDVIGGAMLSGQSIQKTSKQIRERFDVGKYYAERLVRTEMNHFHNTADAIAYEKMGVEQYVFVAVLDNRTSEICQSMDGQKFDYKDRQDGVNYPPLHPNCRSKTRGYMGEDIEKELKRKARNPVTNEVETIDNISYKKWLDKQKIRYGEEAINKSVKRVKRESADKQQYNRYVNRLQNSPYLPKTVDDFKEIKYNKADIYSQLQREYRTIGRINKTSDYVDRDIDTYYTFRKDNVEMTNHAIYDYHIRMFKNDGTQNYDYDKILEIIRKEPNYYDENTNRDVSFYDKISVISETDTKEIVAIRKSRLNKKWKKI